MIKSLFICKRARPDLYTAISVLTTRVKSQIKQIEKIDSIIKILQWKKEDKLIISMDDLHIIKW